MKPNVKKVIQDCISNIPDNEVGLCLSSGIDSNSLLFELLEQGKHVTAFTFTMKGIESRDFIYSKKNCEMFGIELVHIELPNDIEVIEKDIYTLARLGARSKTDFECFFPFLYLYNHPKLTQKYIVSGLGADGHFCISKKGKIHFKDTRIDEFRQLLFSKPNYAQKNLHDEYCKKIGKIHITPFLTQEMIDEFRGTTWEQINKPKEKQPILDSYVDWFNKIKVFPHTNFQKGDSQISKTFSDLTKTNINKKNYKTQVGIFNDIIREIINETKI
jgi:asparagine synthetase B (glutamine-hydrolysing)